MSLLVGGIAIMNIILVSVTERTREIGICMAVGAHGSDILLQFLIESITLSSLGGIIGITASSSSLCSPNGPQDLAFRHRRCVSFQRRRGNFFGFYPARNAAVLDPIDALRYE